MARRLLSTTQRLAISLWQISKGVGVNKEAQKTNLIKYLQSIEPELKTRGFRRAIFDIARNDDSGNFEPGDLGDLWDSDRYKTRPHAYVVREAERSVYLFEVEGTSGINVHKLDSIIDSYWFLENIHWDLRLFVTDQFAGNWRAVPLFTLDMVSQAPEEGPEFPAGTTSRIDWSKTYQKALGQSWCFPALKDEKEATAPSPHSEGNVIKGDF